MKVLNHFTSDEKKVAFSYVFFVFCLLLFSLFIRFFWPTFDTQVISLVGRDRGIIFSAVMAFISWWGMNAMMILPVFIASAIFFIASYRREALFTLGVFIADSINIILKLLINRSRPQAMDVYPKFQQGSFPSGHVVHYVVFFGFILTVMWVSPWIYKALRWIVGALCIFLIGGVSVARIYLGTHWPSDILAAYILGFMMLGWLILLYINGLRQQTSHKIL